MSADAQADFAANLRMLKWGVGGMLGMMGAGGVFAMLTFPGRLKDVEQDHSRMISTDSTIVAQQGRMVEQQEYLACLIQERIEGRDTRACDALRPGQRGGYYYGERQERDYNDRRDR